MPGAGSGYLPPVVVDIIGDLTDLAAKLKVAEEMRDKLDGTEATLRITADGRDAITDARATLSAVRLITAQGATIPIRTEAGMARTIMGLTILDSMMNGGIAEAAGGGGRGRGGGGIGAFLGGMFMGKGGGRGIPFIGGKLPGFLSLGALMGFGAEHIVGAGLGGIASMGGGLLGGGLLGAGVLGNLAVGGGADMAVMKSTLGDTQKYTEALNKYNRAVAVYGAGSIQATAAAYDMNAALGNTTDAAKNAEKALSAAASALNDHFDKATGNARVQAANLMLQVVKLGDTYVPLVAQAAERNLGIINTGLKPLFTWLEGPEGMGVFNTLENNFAKGLPSAVDAADKAIELILKSIAYLSNQTGGASARLDEFFKKWNGADFPTWEHHMDTLVHMFHEWWDLIVLLAKDLGDVFQQTSKEWTGSGGIVQALMDELQRFHVYVTSDYGQNQLQRYFRAGKDEIVSLIKLLPSFITPFAQLELQVAPPLRDIVALLGNALRILLSIPGAGPLIGWGLAVGFMANKLGLLSPGIGFLKTMFTFAGNFITFAAQEGIATAATVAFSGALDGLGAAWAVATGPIGLAVLALAGVALALTHISDISGFVHRLFESDQQKMAEDAQHTASVIAAATAQAEAILANDLADSSSAAAMAMQSNSGAMSKSLLGILNTWTMINTPITGYIENFIKNWDNLDQTTKNVFNTLSTEGVQGSADLLLFTQKLKENNGDAIASLRQLALNGSKSWNDLLSAALNYWTQNKIHEETGAAQTVTVWQEMHDKYLAAAQAQGLAGQAAENWATTNANRVVPGADQARNEIQQLANAHHVTYQNMLDIIQENPQLLQAWLDEQGQAHYTAGQISTLSTALSNMYAYAVQVVNEMAKLFGMGTPTYAGGHAHGGFFSGWGFVGEQGPELAYAGSGGVRVYSNSSPSTQAALRGGNTVTIPTTVNVAVPAGTTPQMAQTIAQAVSRAVNQEMSAVVRNLVSGAYDVRYT